MVLPFSTRNVILALLFACQLICLSTQTLDTKSDEESDELDDEQRGKKSPNIISDLVHQLFYYLLLHSKVFTEKQDHK